MTIQLLNKTASNYLYIMALLSITSHRIVLAYTQIDSQTEVYLSKSTHFTASGYPVPSRSVNGQKESIKTGAACKTKAYCAVCQIVIWGSGADEINDKFVIQYLPDDLTIQLEVYSKWGHLVHRTASYKNNWDDRSSQGIRVIYG